MSIDEYTDFEARLELIQSQFNKLADIMNQELSLIWTQIQQADSQVWRRAYCRALFSFIEGTVYLLKREILLLREGEGSQPDGRDEWILTEVQVTKSGDGTEVRRPFYLPTIENLAYALEEFAYWNWALEYKVDKMSSEWSQLFQANKIRNRITHPKSLSDLDISDSEVETLKKATEGFAVLAFDTLYNAGIALLKMARPFFGGSDQEYWEGVRKAVEEMLSDMH